MANIAERIANLQKAEAEHKEQLAQLIGQRDQLLLQLKEQFGVETLSEAEDKLDKLQKSLAKREAKILQLLDELEAVVES